MGILLVASAPARASCVDPSACVCVNLGGLGGIRAGFAGTIVGAPGKNNEVQVHVDTVSLADPGSPNGSTTKLVVGTIIAVPLQGDKAEARPGKRVLGVSSTGCADDNPDCSPEQMEETVEINLLSDNFITCNGTGLSWTPDDAASLQLRDSCSGEVNRQLEEAGVDVGCCDTCALRPGPIPTTGWVGLLGIPALLVRRRLRRASTRSA